VRLTAAKDRTFKTVRPNQGRLTDASRRLDLDADDHVPAVRFRDPTMELTLAGRRQAMGQPRGAGMTAAHNAVLSVPSWGFRRGRHPAAHSTRRKRRHSWATTPVPNPPRGATEPVTLRRPPQPESGRGWASPPPRDLLSR